MMTVTRKDMARMRGIEWKEADFRAVEFVGVLTGFDFTNTPKRDDIISASLQFSTRMVDWPRFNKFLNYCQTMKGHEDLSGNKFTITIDEKD